MKIQVQNLPKSENDINQSIVITKNNTDVLAEINIGIEGIPISATIDGKDITINNNPIDSEENQTETQNYSIDYDDGTDYTVPAKSIITKDKNGKKISEKKQEFNSGVYNTTKTERFFYNDNNEHILSVVKESSKTKIIINPNSNSLYQSPDLEITLSGHQEDKNLLIPDNLTLYTDSVKLQSEGKEYRIIPSIQTRVIEPIENDGTSETTFDKDGIQQEKVVTTYESLSIDSPKTISVFDSDNEPVRYAKFEHRHDIHPVEKYHRGFSDESKPDFKPGIITFFDNSGGDPKRTHRKTLDSSGNVSREINYNNDGTINQATNYYENGNVRSIESDFRQGEDGQERPKKITRFNEDGTKRGILDRIDDIINGKNTKKKPYQP